MRAINPSQQPTPPNVHTVMKRAVATDVDHLGANNTSPVQQQPLFSRTQPLRHHKISSKTWSLMRRVRNSSHVTLRPRPPLPRSCQLNSLSISTTAKHQHILLVSIQLRNSCSSYLTLNRTRHYNWTKLDALQKHSFIVSNS